MSEPAGQKKGGSFARATSLLKPVLAGLAGLFVGYTIYDLAERWDGASVSVDPLGLFVSLVMSAVALLLQLSAFRALLSGWLKTSLPYYPSARLYLDSQVARYTPGKIGLLAVRMMGAASLGVSAKAMGASVFVEMLSWVSAGGLVGGAALLFSSEFFFSELFFPESARIAPVLSQVPLLVCMASSAFLFLLVSVDRTNLPKSVLRVLAAPGAGPLVPVQVPLFHLAHFVAWTFAGAALAMSVGASPDQALLVGGILCAAIVAGFLALFAPAGAGVREAIVIALASPVLGPTRSLAVSLLARMVSVATELLLFAWFRYREKRADSSD